MNLEIGETYRIKHARFGWATVKVLSGDENWIEVVIIEGSLVGMNDSWEPGDCKNLRISHITEATKESYE